MTYHTIRKLFGEYLAKNHPELEFCEDDEMEEKIRVLGNECKIFIPFNNLFNKNMLAMINKQRFIKGKVYNINWKKEDAIEVEEIPKKREVKVLSVSSDNKKGIDFESKKRRRRIMKENMFKEEYYDEKSGKFIKIFKCELPGCNRQYTSSFGLKYHMKEGHSEEKLSVPKPFVCKVENCGRKYKNNNGLKYHLKNFHDIN